MSQPPQYPEFPYPMPPGREPPQPSQPTPIPVVDPGGGALRDRLLEQRRILMSGLLDHRTVTDVAAQLMALDGSSSRDVEIIISSPGGPLSEVFPILGVVDLMRAKVNVTVIGSVGGTATAFVAACSGKRTAAAHASFSLRLDTTESIEGTAGDIVRRADELSTLRARFLAVLSAATGHDEGALADEIDRGRAHTADEAIALGIIDTVTGRP